MSRYISSWTCSFAPRSTRFKSSHTILSLKISKSFVLILYSQIGLKCRHELYFLPLLCTIHIFHLIMYSSCLFFHWWLLVGVYFNEIEFYKTFTCEIECGTISDICFKSISRFRKASQLFFISNSTDVFWNPILSYIDLQP